MRNRFLEYSQAIHATFDRLTRLSTPLTLSVLLSFGALSQLSFAAQANEAATAQLALDDALKVTAESERALASLSAYLKPVQAFKANFKQTVEDESGALIEEYYGQIQVQRPGKLNWQSMRPFKQLLVADGQSIWFYDQDLKQVTKRSANDQLTQAPLLILSGDTQGLKRHFNISQTTDETGKTRQYQLKPTTPSSLFERVLLSFKEGQLSELTIIDSLAQTTRMRLSDFEKNPNIDPQQFKFNPPKGVTVIRDE